MTVASAITAEYPVNDYAGLLGMKGFSDKALQLHFSLYQGYVKNTNGLIKELSSLATAGKATTPQYAELKRRFGWEFDGMRLHEYYFGNLGGEEAVLDSNSSLMKLIERTFGSYDAWKEDFIATGKMRGIGWVILSYDANTGKLFNTWINEHDVGHLAGTTPLLVMDVFEHAYLPDYGTNRGDYITAFFNNVNWDAVKKRLK